MDSKELLRTLGLTTYEAEVYEALLKVEQAKVQDLAQIVTVPRPQIYVALGTLLEKGMCREIRGPVTYYSAVAPGLAFRGVLKQEEEMLKAKAEGLSKLEEEHRRLEPENVPQNFVQVLRGRQVKRFIDELTAETKEELLITLKYTVPQSPKSLAGAVASERAVLGRGVRVRCLYEQASLAQPEIRSALAELAQEGEQARVVESVPLDMMVFDRRAALFSLSTRRDVTVFCYTHPDLIQVMRDSFEHVWLKGKDVAKALKESGNESR